MRILGIATIATTVGTIAILNANKNKGKNTTEHMLTKVQIQDWLKSEQSHNEFQTRNKTATVSLPNGDYPVYPMP